MNIGIICPSHVPFAIGGAERLWTDLCRAINSSGTHQADLIKLPAPESGFWEIIDSYWTFYNLNVNYFDLIISGKNPAWMVRHSNHSIYMLHPLRGVYDTYHLFRLPYDVSSNSRFINEISRACDKGIATDDLFSLLADLRSSDQIDPNQTKLPSPFLRKVLHRFDSNAMKEVRFFSAISKTVAKRSEYFHGHDPVNVYCPPSDLVRKSAAPEPYFFTYSRLDSAKRIDLLISAFKQLKSSYKFKIAGTGPDADSLKALALDDSRVEFLGRLSDDTLADVLSRAYAVPFAPYQEDYGLVAIEAMQSGKPVITCTDSGGPTDFVDDGRNGFLSTPESSAIAKAFNRCLRATNYPSMSNAAKLAVAAVTWKNVVAGLTEAHQTPYRHSRARIRVLSLSTYPIYPPKGGGQARVYYLCGQLSSEFEVHVICLVDGSLKPETHRLSSTFAIECIPADPAYSSVDWDHYQASGIPTTDVVMGDHFALASAFCDAVKRRIEVSDIIIAEQPYVFPAIAALGGSSKVTIYNSQNDELRLKQQMFRKSPLRDKILDMVERAERLACDLSSLIVFCSEADRTSMQTDYGFASNKRSIMVKNGAATSTISYVSSRERREMRENVGISGRCAIFIASWHEPNIEAVRQISKFAERSPDIFFLVVGSVGDYFKTANEAHAQNMAFTGVVTAEEKDVLLQIVDLGLNPMSTGSGTNIKMFDYMAAGLPIVTTPVGARGLELPQGIALTGELDSFSVLIREALILRRSIQRRLFVMERYDWDVVGREYRNAIRDLVEQSNSRI